MLKSRTSLAVLATTIVTVIVAGILFLVPGYSLDHGHAEGTLVDSPYPSIQTRQVQKKADGRDINLEYPVTGNQSIDEVVANDIDARAQRTTDQPANIGYAISHYDDRWLSITVTDQSPAAPAFWTFDRGTGTAVSIKALLNDSPRAVEAFSAYAQGQLVNQFHADREMDFTQFTIDHGAISYPFPGMPLRLPLGEVFPYLNVDTISHLGVKPAPKSLACPQHCVAITYDDGPDVYTPQVLDELKNHGAHATFFTIGNKVPGHEAVVKRAVDEGNDVGSHSWSHPKLSTLNAAQLAAQLNDTNNVLTKATGVAPHLLRPPYGATNGTVTATAGRYGLATIMWSIDTKDWADRNSQVVCERAVSGATDGSIILMHDIHKTTADATPCVIEGLQKRGFTLVTVSDLVGGKPQPGRQYSKG